jgi:hypothetical protein
MAMGTGMAIALGAGALLSGMAGGQSDKESQTGTRKLDLDPASSQENFFAGTPGQSAVNAGLFGGMVDGQFQLGAKSRPAVAAQPGFLEQNFGTIQGMVGAGPGQSDIQRGVESQRSLADMFQQYSQSGGWANQQDIAQSQQFAGQMFNPQRVAMQQAFQDQQTQADRQAALMGRSTNDPILRAKLAQEQTRQGSLLEAQQGAYGAQLAQQQPDRRLGYAQQGAAVQGDLATQAMRNRLALSSLGESMLGRERNFRLQSAGSTSTSFGESGGGFKGFMEGAFGGAGAAGKIFSGFGG